MRNNDEFLNEEVINSRLEALWQKDKLWPAVLASRAVLRIFPLIGIEGNFDFWFSQNDKSSTGRANDSKFAGAQKSLDGSIDQPIREDRRVKYLLANFVACRSVFEQASLPGDERQMEKLGTVALSARVAAKAAKPSNANKVSEIAAASAADVGYAAAAAAATRAAGPARVVADAVAAAAAKAVRADTSADAKIRTAARTVAARSAADAATRAFINDLESAEESNSIIAFIERALWTVQPLENIEIIRQKRFIPAVQKLAEESSSLSPNDAKALNVMIWQYDEYLTGRQSHSYREAADIKYQPSTAQAREEATGELDSLNRGALVEGLSGILCDKAHTYPLTIGLMGHWGSGKTTVLELLKKQLSDIDCTQPFLFGEFNAWVYEHAKNSQAAMAHEVISALTACDTLEVVSTDASSWQNLADSFINLKRKITWQLWGRLRLVFGFAVQRHFGKIFGMMVWLLLFLAAFIVFLGQGLSSSADITTPVTFLSLVAILGSFWKFTKSFRDVVSQPLTSKLLTYIKLPDYAAHIGEISQMQQDVRVMAKLRLGFIEKNCFDYLGKKTPQRRMLFVVDDLDRCSPQGIVKTFEAIRLVLNIPQVTVVIAVDQRIALAALALHYKDIEPYHTLQDAKAIARDYLAKMIQLPVVLGNGDDESIKTYLGEIWPEDLQSEWLRYFNGKPKSKQNEAGKTGVDEPKEASQQSHNQKVTIGTETESEALTKEQLIEMVLSDPSKKSTSPSEIKVGLSDLQKAALYFWATQFGLTNARQLKRLDNSYNLIRLVSEREDEVCRRGNTRGLSEKAVQFSFGYLVSLMVLVVAD